MRVGGGGRVKHEGGICELVGKGGELGFDYLLPDSKMCCKIKRMFACVGIY